MFKKNCIRNEFGINRVLKDLYRFECVDLPFMLQQMKINSNAFTLILLEGSNDFVTSQFAGLIQNWVSLVAHRQLFLALIFTNRVRKISPFKHFSWTKINHHKDAGGPTTSALQVAFYPKSSLVKRETKTHKWLLSDFNKSTIRGLPTEPPADMDVLLILSDVHNMHVALCVFSATGWVYRRLSCPEVLRCIDIPQQMDKILVDKCGSNLKSDRWSHILLAPPGKVLLFLINSVPTFRFCTDKIHVETGRKAEIKSNLQFKSIIQGYFISDGVLSDKDRNPKAVKSDNAEVPLESWNDKVVRGNSTVEQDNALEIIRNTLAIRFYRRSLFLSFKIYMMKTHGSNWLKRLTYARKNKINKIGLGER